MVTQEYLNQIDQGLAANMEEVAGTRGMIQTTREEADFSHCSSSSLFVINLKFMYFYNELWKHVTCIFLDQESKGR